MRRDVVRGVGAQLPGPPERPVGHRPSEFEEKTGAAVRILEHIVQCGDEVVDLLLAADQRREQFDDVDIVRRHLGQDPVAMEEGHDQHLGEDGRDGGVRASGSAGAGPFDVGAPNSSPIINPFPLTS